MCCLLEVTCEFASLPANKKKMKSKAIEAGASTEVLPCGNVSPFILLSLEA